MDKNTLKELIENEGLSFYDTENANENGQNIFRVYITHQNGVTLDMCAKISNIISPILDLEPPMKGKYFLEVSSPGIERKLKKPQHFMASLNEMVEITLVSTEKIIGELKSADENGIDILEDKETLHIAYDDIHVAKTYVQW